MWQSNNFDEIHQFEDDTLGKPRIWCDDNNNDDKDSLAANGDNDDDDKDKRQCLATLDGDNDDDLLQQPHSTALRSSNRYMSCQTGGGPY